MKNIFIKNYTKNTHSFLIPFLFFLLIFVLWQIISSTGLVKSFILPSPQAILHSLITDSQLIFSNALITFSITIIGIIISLLFAFINALAMYYIPLLHKLFYPILLVFQIIPILIFAPLLVIIFGYGFLTQLLIVSTMCFFPMLLNLLRGFEDVPTEQIMLLQSMGAKKYQIFYWVILPNALFSLCSGLRLSITYAISASIISEWVSAIRGLGVLMISSQKSFLVERVFAINAVIILLSIILYVSAIAIEYKIMPWRKYIK